MAAPLGPERRRPDDAGGDAAPHSALPHSIETHSALPHSIETHSSVPHSTETHSSVPHSTETHSSVPHGALPHSIESHDALPHGALPHSSVPHSIETRSALPHSALPHSIETHSSVPHSVLPHSIETRSALPHSALPHSIETRSALPHSATPHSIESHGALPHSTAPHSVAPHSAEPHNSVPHSTVPHSSAPHSSMPHSTPHSSVPHSSVPHSPSPHSSVPHGAPHSSVPHSAEPHSAEPHSAEPHSSMPHSSMPHSTEPHSTEPHSTEPHSAEPHSSVPHTTAPHSSMPHSTPHSSVPHSSMPHSIETHSSVPHSAEPHGAPHSAEPHSPSPHSSVPHSSVPHSTEPHSSVPHSIETRSSVPHSTEPHGAPHSSAPHSAAPHSAAPHSAEPHSSVPHTTAPHSSVPHSSVPHSPVPHSPVPHSAPHGVTPRRARLTVAVLCYINLLNYMDRFTVAGVLPDIEEYFGIGDGSSGLLQTVFISSYMALAPLFGFLGDRYNRKRLLGVGLSLWVGVTLGSSFVPPQRFWALLLGRALVGVGEASYSTVAPTLIADLYAGTARSRALGCFYLAVPLGSGLGYIAGAKVKEALSDWHWALRVTPALGLLAVVLLMGVVAEPPRGAMDGAQPGAAPHSSWGADLRALAENRSFVLSTLGFTAVAFVSGALALWGPAFLYRARMAQRGAATPWGGESSAKESLVFGALTCATGVLGVGSGVSLSQWLRPHWPHADPLLCAVGLLGAAPCLLLALLCAPRAVGTAYVFIFIGETLLSLNWAIVADILLYVVVPTRRSTAEALQIVVSHLLGDAGSPYLVGVLSDALRSQSPFSYGAEVRSLQRALLLTPFVAAVGGGCFLGTALSLSRDRLRHEPPVSAEDSDGDTAVPRGGQTTKVTV